MHLYKILHSNLLQWVWWVARLFQKVDKPLLSFQMLVLTDLLRSGVPVAFVEVLLNIPVPSS